MCRRRLFVAAGLLLTATAALADDHRPLPTQALAPSDDAPSSTFLNRVIMPRVDLRLRGSSAAALDFASFRTNPLANPWTRDRAAVEQVGTLALNATKDAVKRYAIDRLGLDNWSLPLAGSKGTGVDSLRTDSGGTRLRFGVAHMAPKAELMIPSGNTGRVTFGLDGRGRMSAGFENASAHLRVGGSYDPSSHDLNAVFVTRF